MRWILLALLPIAGCKKDERGGRKSVDDLVLDAVSPELWLPGTVVTLQGRDFLPEENGPTTVILARDLSAELPASFVDYQTLQVTWPGGDAGTWDVRVKLSTASAYDGRTHTSNNLSLPVEVADTVTPTIVEVADGGSHVNDPVVVSGDGFLLAGEGTTVAVVEGCFFADAGSGCTSVGPVEVPTTPVDGLDRGALSFLFAPEIAGIEPGAFDGTLQLVNRHGGGTETRSEVVPLVHDVGVPFVSAFDPGAASLGQYVVIGGGGFVGPGPGDPAAVTLIELDGTFAPPGLPASDVALTLVGELTDDGVLRYVVNEEDALGRVVDLRTAVGTFSGTARPVVEYGTSAVVGQPVPVELSLQPVEQVVWLKRLPSFVESLRNFGLRQAEDAIVDVVERDYAGVNLELRLDEPEDFALYSVVELSGPDPNGLGLLGYDNTPGKDVDNQRLYDTIGGVNALTQQDGYPGYGGVFLDSLFAYSKHPRAGIEDLGLGEKVFDDLFDPLRPDVEGGSRVTSDELDDLYRPGSNSDCPTSGRRKVVGCAVFTLGNLVGTTLSHEIAHSLGLADPDGESFHNTGDWTDAIMDGGSSRTFRERAEVKGEGPGEFCQGGYDYLREILPTSLPDPIADRQDCY